MVELVPFPSDWDSALVLVPHPDDPEYGIAAAVAKWTASGKTVRYALACRGEVGIEGMPAVQAPNQRDHIEFSNAVAEAYDSLPDRHGGCSKTALTSRMPR